MRSSGLSERTRILWSPIVRLIARALTLERHLPVDQRLNYDREVRERHRVEVREHSPRRNPGLVSGTLTVGELPT